MNIYTLPYCQAYPDLTPVINMFEPRPDTTLTKELSCWYRPAFINSLNISAALFIRFSKAGKHIQRQFASRYFDYAGFSLLFHCKEDDFNYTILDNITLVSDKFDLSLLDEDSPFCSQIGGETLKLYPNSINREYISKSIETLTKGSSIRCGDLLIIELTPLTQINGDVTVRSEYRDKVLFEFEVKW